MDVFRAFSPIPFKILRHIDSSNQLITLFTNTFSLPYLLLSFGYISAHPSQSPEVWPSTPDKRIAKVEEQIHIALRQDRRSSPAGDIYLIAIFRKILRTSLPNCICLKNGSRRAAVPCRLPIRAMNIAVSVTD